MDKNLCGSRADLRETPWQYLRDLQHPGIIYIGFYEVDVQTKMSLLQDEPVKLYQDTIPFSNVLLLPNFVRTPHLSSQAVTNSLLGLWRATRSPLYNKATEFTFHIVLSSLGTDSISKITIAGPEGLPLPHIYVSMNHNRWIENICHYKNPLK